MAEGWLVVDVQVSVSRAARFPLELRHMFVCGVHQCQIYWIDMSFEDI